MTDRDLRPGSLRQTRRSSPSAPRPTSSRTRGGPRRGHAVGRRGLWPTQASRWKGSPRWPLQGSGSGRRNAYRGATARSSVSSRLYNGEIGLDVVGRSRPTYKVTAVGCCSASPRWCSAASTSASTSPRQQLPAARHDRTAGRGPGGRRGCPRRSPARRSSAATPCWCARRSWTRTTSGGVTRSPTPRIEPNQVSLEAVSAEGQRHHRPGDPRPGGLPGRGHRLPRRCASSRRWPSARSSRSCTTSS